MNPPAKTKEAGKQGRGMAMTLVKTRAEAPGANIYLDRVERLAPAILAAADQGERDRRITPDLMAELHGAGLFRMLLPRPYGGAELEPAQFHRTLEAIAALDASTAWCICQGNGCAMTAAYVDREVAEEVWGSDPKAVLAWGPPIRSEAIAEGRGLRLSGRWTFASGGRHATWLGGHAPIIEADGTPRLIQTLLFPMSRAKWHDVWDVIGLRATGSDSFEVKDLAVPTPYAVTREDPAERRHQSTLYLFPAMSLYAAGFSGTALGIARAMLTAFQELVMEKTPRLQRSRLADQETVQTEIALCHARLGAARAFLERELGLIWQSAVATNQVTIADRMRIRLAVTYGIHEAKEVANTVYDAAGATAIFAGGPYERRFRDMHTVVQQLQGRKSNFKTVGAYMVGHPPDMTVI
jgi:indole-3-acetate monooxygenase